MDFHDAQHQAMMHLDGPAMIIAGPGSGKTTVITYRIKTLIEHYQINPANLLVVTFTKAAAKEMQERFLQITEKDRYYVNFGTFHSIFFRILKLAYGFHAGNIIREEQKIQLMRELIEHVNAGQQEAHRIQAEEGEEVDLASSILNEISLIKSEMLQLDYYYPKSCSQEVFKKIYQTYEEHLRSANRIDFDDMMVLCYELLTQRPDILAAWQKKYQYILVDEFQDICRIQYEIIKLLAKPDDHLFIVGDDDQSIYRFRGARPEIMLGFEHDFPKAKKILLSVNYRSTETIIQAANRLIGRNTIRYPKDIQAFRMAGKPIQTRAWNDAREETLGIIQEIQDYINSGFAYQDIAVLFRTNQDSRLLVEKLMEYNIPFTMRDVLPSIYEHWIAKNILAYMRVAAGERSRRLVLQMINRPNRYIGRDAMETQEVEWERVKSFYQDKNWMVERIEQLEYDLTMIQGMKPSAAVNYIRKGIGYDCYLREYATQRRIDPAELLAILDQLQESSLEFSNLGQWLEHIEAYGRELQQKARDQDHLHEGVSLMTMHSAKGLEFPIVYILDANEGVVPHHKAVLDVDLEEERRMFYVAMTRAKERLHIYAAKERYGKKQEISRFVREYLPAKEE